MADAAMFALTGAQEELLRALMAAWDESEEEERLERLRQREEDVECLDAFARLLEVSGFAEGQDLTRVQWTELFALARSLAPNPNLDARLFREPGEPEAINRDLRDLLFGKGSAPLRLRGFLTRRRAGAQTALQLLATTYPREWPLVTRTGLDRIGLSAPQRAAAIRTARIQYALPEPVIGQETRTLAPVPLGVPDTDPVLRILGQVVVYRAIQDLLDSPDYIALHRLLLAPTGAGAAGTSRKTKSISSAYLGRPPGPTVYPNWVSESRDVDYAADGAMGDSLLEPEAVDITGVSENAVLAELEHYVMGQGFTFPALTVRDYYISLKTKPFVLLFGLSGTGKTRLTSLFAEALTGNADMQYRILPVRPDWVDPTAVLGFVNFLAGGGEGRYVSTPFVEFLLRASRPENRGHAFFLCLDEMNLARIEHYFAEVLSAMETPNKELMLPMNRSVRLPPNLFLTGTLNLDEGTQSVSRRVFDRANTIGFHDVRLDAEPLAQPVDGGDERIPASVRQAVFLSGRAGSVSEARKKLQANWKGEGDPTASVVQTLADVNKVLQPTGYPVTYRVRDEALRYCANSFDASGAGLLSPEDPDDQEANLRVALDLQALQKVLPRFVGTLEQIEAPLRGMAEWAARHRLARTGEKLARMLARMERDGFVGFDEV